MSDFEVDGKRYRTNKRLDAFSQLHLARKLAPLIVSLTPSQEMRQKLQADANGDGRPLVDIAELAMPVIEGLAEMKTEDVDFISSTCLGVVQRYQGAAWADIWNGPAKRMMFDDIDGMALLQITFNVLQENLANFMRAPLSALSQPSQTTGESQESMSGFQRTG
jgi:hypothetical protein